MLKLQDALLTDGLPQIIAKEPWAQAMAYAVNNQMRRLLTCADRVRHVADIDNAPDTLLDVLAAELRLPHYDVGYSLQVKRELVKGGLSYWASAGTVASVSEILTKVFGDAEIEEGLYDYGSMGCIFRIVTSNPQVTGATLEQFKKTTQNIKRLSAQLEEVVVEMAIPNMSVYNGFALYTHTETTLKQEG